MIKNSFLYLFLREVKSNIKLASCVGFKGVLTLSWIKSRIPKTKEKIKLWNLWEKKHNIIVSYILKNLAKYRNEEYRGCIGTNGKVIDNTIWVFWWQGENAMPEVVATCYQQLKKHSGEHSVVLVTEKNIHEYLSIPKCISNKVGKTMTYIAFSDYVRLNLLAIYGGLWVDSTFLLTSDIDETIFEYNFYSIKNQPTDNQYVCKYRWAVNFMFVPRKSQIMYHVRNMFAAFWERENVLIDYLLIDYCFETEARLNEDFNKYLADLPISNEDSHELRIHFNMPFNQAKWNHWTEATSCFKLTYKGQLCKESDGKLTFYGYIINNLK